MQGRISQSQIQQVRRMMLAQQGGRCLLCGQKIEIGTDVLDHDHVTGAIRGVLHRGCNAMLGHIENNRPRHLLTDPDKFKAWLSSVYQYIYTDYSGRQLYPTHKSPEEKKVAAADKRKKKLAKDRIAAASPEMAAALKQRDAAMKAMRAKKNRPRVKGSSDGS